MLLKSNLQEAEHLCRLVSDPDVAADFIFFAPAMPVGLASRPSFASTEILDEEDLTLVSSTGFSELLSGAVASEAPTRVVIADNASFSVLESCSARALSTVHIEPNGSVRAVAIYEGTVANVLEDDPATIRTRIRERLAEPQLSSLMASITSYRQWAIAARQIDLLYAAPEDISRIRKRPTYGDS